MKRLTVLFISLLLSGCISLSSLNPFSSPEGIKVDAQIGKTNEKVTGVKAEEFSLVNKTNNAGTVVEDSRYGSISGNISIDEQVPVWIWLLALLGWLLPSPSEIWKGLGKFMWDIRVFFKKG